MTFVKFQKINLPFR